MLEIVLKRKSHTGLVIISLFVQFGLGSLGFFVLSAFFLFFCYLGRRARQEGVEQVRPVVQWVVSRERLTKANKGLWRTKTRCRDLGRNKKKPRETFLAGHYDCVSATEADCL